MARISINQRLDRLESVLHLIRSELTELSILIKGPASDVKIPEENALENAILSPKEVAEILGIDIDTIYLKCKNKELPHFRMGKLYKFRRTDVLDWREAQKKISAVCVDDYVNSYLQKHSLKG